MGPLPSWQSERAAALGCLRSISNFLLFKVQINFQLGLPPSPIAVSITILWKVLLL